MRRAARKDKNHAEVVKAFRKMGAWVADLSGAGVPGLPDLLLCIKGTYVLAEVKDGSTSPSKHKKTPAQVEFHEDCPGLIWMIESLEDVATCVRYYRLG